ncbi:ketopantoate reductase family protein [Tunturiibacter empetritectus]|uniref:2-dehydropantoate 2-reductase n=1 Tax=Tunturiibacter lichenicola TaxID=2051959 RepID=A0A852VJJ7_9BACT|nr:ketopantoate reductase family protein [Edaphobacter lichenicola]NYF90325.1 2-dehydropantoate 2-reductase [Edaphobacter lichenicola]
MKILVVGAGAVGGYFGARLAQAGRDVTFLVRPARAEQLQKDGLRILSPHGDATLKPKTITTSEITTPYDLIFLSVKAQALDQAIKDLTPAVGPDTMIYPVLNGMRHMETLSQVFGEQKVLGGVCMVSTELDDQNRIVQMTPMQKLIYGERNGEGERSGEITPRIRALDEALRDASFDTELSTTITQAMWHKWVMIASLGLVTCLLGGPIGEVNSVPDGEQTALQAVDECTAIGKACGFPYPPPLHEWLRKQATTKDSKLTSSLYRDLQKGAPIEVDTILGDLLDQGHAHHLETPLLQACCVRLRVYQNNLKLS